MSHMTVNQLKKKLERLVAQGHGRCRVVMDKLSFSPNDDATHLEVCGIGIENINLLDGDGFTAVDSKGREKSSNVLTIAGPCRCDEKGNLLDWNEVHNPHWRSRFDVMLPDTASPDGLTPPATNERKDGE